MPRSFLIGASRRNLEMDYENICKWIYLTCLYVCICLSRYQSWCDIKRLILLNRWLTLSNLHVIPSDNYTEPLDLRKKPIKEENYVPWRFWEDRENVPIRKSEISPRKAALNLSLLTNTSNLTCTKCKKNFSSETNLKKHSSKCSKEEISCKFCDKTYTSIGALKMHIRTHTLPCKCSFCGKAFSRPWLLQGHIRTHTGEKPFNCNQCSRAFADRSNLRAHLQTHECVKKYSCQTCSKSFSRMSLLTKHRITCL